MTDRTNLSWVDHMLSWMQSTRLPVLPTAALGGGVVYVGLTWVQWTGGAYAFGTFNLFHANYVFELVYIILLMRALNGWADSAFDEYASVLEADESERHRLKFKLLHSPPRPTMLVSLVSALVFLLLLYLVLSQGLFLGQDPLGVIGFGDTPLSIAFLVVLAVIRWFMYGGFGYHIYHQLTTISEIYSDWTRINLWNTRPLYAFSRHTARTGLGIVVSPYLWLATGAEFSATPFAAAISTVFAAFAILIFLLPLRGVHTLLAREKVDQLGQLARQLDTLKNRLDQAVEQEALSDIEGLDKAISRYLDLKANLESVATWPWEPGLFRRFVGTLMIPLVIWVLQQILNRYFPL